MWQFAEVTEGMSEACEALYIPVVGGNVSFYNESRGRDIDPTPVVGLVGVIDELDAVPPPPALARRIAHRRARCHDAPSSAARSSRRATGCVTARRPRSISTQRAALARPGARRSSASASVDGVHDCSDGGLAVALAEMAIAGECGAQVVARRRDLLPALAWFSESASRVVLSVAPDGVDEVLDARCRARGCLPPTSASPAATASCRPISTSRSPTPPTPGATPSHARSDVRAAGPLVAGSLHRRYWSGNGSGNRARLRGVRRLHAGSGRGADSPTTACTRSSTEVRSRPGSR